MGERAQAYKGRQRALLGTPRIGGSHKSRQQGGWIPRGGDCNVPHRLHMGMGMCLYVYLHNS
jgi:hypothetical protein